MKNIIFILLIFLCLDCKPTKSNLVVKEIEPIHYYVDHIYYKSDFSRPGFKIKAHSIITLTQDSIEFIQWDSLTVVMKVYKGLIKSRRMVKSVRGLPAEKIYLAGTNWLLYHERNDFIMYELDERDNKKGVSFMYLSMKTLHQSEYKWILGRMQKKKL